MKTNRIIAIHLLNDWSGSPLVFRQALDALRQDGHTVDLFTATPGGCGFLSDLPGVTLHALPYRWSPVKLVTLLNYLLVQARLFVKLLFFLRSTDRVYINTLLPFGAALAGWLRGCAVVYHVHEVSLKPRLLKAWLRAVANYTARRVLFVSAYTQQQTGLRRPTSQLIYNALPDSFLQQARPISSPNMVSPFTALMLCSNKAYKGIHEFVGCARSLPHIQFMLVLNAGEAEVDAFVQTASPPSNCFVYPAQADTIPFYQQAHVVLNLSHPTAWVETFGLTILEAMACGRPVITPTVGGICELIENGKEGFQIDVRQLPMLVQTLRRLSSDVVLYRQLAEAARQRADQFSTTTFQIRLLQAFASLDPSTMPGNVPQRYPSPAEAA
ncbi:glycosyltransferase family 4 protein [Fibrella sp. WM1]|uniref:glycosyltransferase family 4 protein n=1 Tax=Fibrella musci TaxID=3242485 RepID=UPI0035215442